VIQQWMFNFASKVELLLRDLYHTDASSLSVRLEHKGSRGKRGRVVVDLAGPKWPPGCWLLRFI
jgi:hypothetical protein